MVNSNKSIFEYNISPFIQGGAVLATILVFNLFALLFGAIGLDTDEGTPWLISCSLTFFLSLAIRFLVLQQTIRMHTGGNLY